MLKYLPARPRRYAFILYGLLTRAMTLGVRCAIFNEAGHVFLVRHTYVRGWHMPGGGVERGETMVQAVRKEVQEEAGITLATPPDLFALYRNTIHSRFDHVSLYITRNVPDAPLPKPNLEIAECGYFSLDDLPEGTSRPTLACLQEITEGKPAREIW